MSDFTEKVRAMLEGITKEPWSLNEYDRIMIEHDPLLVHGVAIPCGHHKDLSEAKANGKLLFNAPTLLREACGRIEKLEKVARQARDIVSWSDGKEAYQGEVEINSLLIASLDDALSALDAKEQS